MRIPTIIYCICFVSALHAQSYIPLISDDARWDESSSEYNTNSFLDEVNGHSFFLRGDTTINNQAYTNVYYQHMWFQVRMSGSILESTNLNLPALLIGGIREDTAAMKVYYLDYGTSGWGGSFIDINQFPNNEVLLYDFSLVAGDLVQFGTNSNYMVYDVYNTTYTDGIARKKWELFNQDWTEGIGSSLGLFGSYRQDLTYAYVSYDLDCFSTNGQYVFSSTYCDSVPEISTVSTTDISDLKDEIQLFPNPVSNRLQIEILDKNLNIDQINLLNVSGTQLPVNARTNGRRLSIDVSTIPSGIYVLNLLLQDGQTLFEKIVIAR